ncbi:GntR family transcriptional regulator [Planomonospora corallina]|uniref:GntR family transcriptional regulator n=1 Tax=Planomonospora corallina TaxID=1806052 RepID=A0ABV8I5T5_9ACTN
MLDHEGDTHLYLQVAEIIRQRVVSGAIRPGSAVPSESELRSEFGIARTTARRAIRVLRDEGLVHTVQGEGTFVGPPDASRRGDRSISVYRQIAQELIGRITRGDLKPRRAIPSEATLVEQYGAARETVRHAIALLREQGWVYTVPQRGTYVHKREKWSTERKRSPAEPHQRPTGDAQRAEYSISATDGEIPVGSMPGEARDARAELRARARRLGVLAERPERLPDA